MREWKSRSQDGQRIAWWCGGAAVVEDCHGVRVALTLAASSPVEPRAVVGRLLGQTCCGRWRLPAMWVTRRVVVVLACRMVLGRQRPLEFPSPSLSLPTLLCTPPAAIHRPQVYTARSGTGPLPQTRVPSRYALSVFPVIFRLCLRLISHDTSGDLTGSLLRCLRYLQKNKTTGSGFFSLQIRGKSLRTTQSGNTADAME